VWASTTSDLRGLQKESIANDRIAATWYTNGSETIDLIITDGHSHNIAVYCLDWDTTARQERIDILDGANTVLDSRTVTSFNSGAYLVWTVSGHVQVRVTLTGGANAVISGLFFDAVPSAVPITINTAPNGLGVTVDAVLARCHGGGSEWAGGV